MKIVELRKLCEAASPGSIGHLAVKNYDGSDHERLVNIFPSIGESITGEVPYVVTLPKGDAAFFIAARTALPRLLDVAEAAESARAVTKECKECVSGPKPIMCILEPATCHTYRITKALDALK